MAAELAEPAGWVDNGDGMAAELAEPTGWGTQAGQVVPSEGRVASFR